MKFTTLILTVLLLIGSAAAKDKINPADFTIKATVTGFGQIVTGTESTTLPFCNNPQGAFQKGYCGAAGRGGSRTVTEDVLTVEIGDFIYQLQGWRLPLGDYQVRAKSRRGVDGFEFLLSDKHGRPEAWFYEIIGQSKKTSH